MKKVIFVSVVFAACVSGLTFTSCESAAVKSDKADTKVMDAKEDLQKAETAADVATVKAADAEAWKTFKLECETKINENDVSIAALRAGMKKTGNKIDATYAKSIDQLQQRNKDLRARLAAYNTGQSDWESFKREFNHDMDGIGQSLKDLAVNNNK